MHPTSRSDSALRRAGQEQVYRGALVFAGGAEQRSIIYRVNLQALALYRDDQIAKMVVSGLLGGVLVPLPAVVWFLAIESMLNPNDPNWLGGCCVVVLLGFILVVCCLPFFYLAAARSRLMTLSAMVGVLARQPRATLGFAAEKLGTSVLHARHILLDASRLGFVLEADGRAYPHVTPPPAPPPPPAPLFAGELHASARVIIVTSNAGEEGPSTARTPRSLPASSDELAVGDILGDRYELVGFLGSGGMGHVFEAKHTRTGRAYALKVLRADASLTKASRARFEREARLAGSIGHSGIVAIHDYDETPNGLNFLVMDLLVGETLDERLGKVRVLPYPEARRIVLEVAAALSAAHMRGLVHRDVKPANIFLVKNEGGVSRAVLLDFGVVKDLSNKSMQITSTGATIGTPYYMAPEQAVGQAVDGRADEYALATVLYEMLCGEPPFLDETIGGAFTRLLTEPPIGLSRAAKTPFPYALEPIVLQALAKNPAARFPTIAHFADAVARVR